MLTSRPFWALLPDWQTLPPNNTVGWELLREFLIDLVIYWTCVLLVWHCGVTDLLWTYIRIYLWANLTKLTLYNLIFRITKAPEISSLRKSYLVILTIVCLITLLLTNNLDEIRNEKQILLCKHSVWKRVLWMDIGFRFLSSSTWNLFWNSNKNKNPAFHWGTNWRKEHFPSRECCSLKFAEALSQV